MSDEKTTRLARGVEPQEPKDLAAKYRGIPPEVKAEAVKLMAQARVSVAEGTELPRTKREDNDSAVRDKHRHIKDTEQESLTQPVASGTRQAGQQKTQEAERTTETIAKGTEKTPETKAPAASTPTPAELAAKYRGQSQEAQRSTSVSREQLGNTSPGHARAQQPPTPQREGPGRG